MRARGVCQGFGDSGAVVDECWATPVRCVSVHSLQGVELHLTDKPEPQDPAATAPRGQGAAWGGALADDAADSGRAMHLMAVARAPPPDTRC